ncbi:MAG: LVIVD repeat-containing protein [Phycisphaerae bacterium]
MMRYGCVAQATMALWLGLLGASAHAGGVNATLVGHWDEFNGSYGDVWADGDYAYVGHWGSAGVDIIDISDPTQPFRVAAYLLPPPNTTASAQDVKVAAGLLFIALEGAGNSVHIVDVRDPANPAGLVDIAIAGFTAIHNVFYDGGFLYMADSGTPRVGIVDLTALDPDDPPPAPITTTTWMLNDVGTSFVHDVTVLDGRMYVSAWDSGIWIYDVSDVANAPPTLLGSGPGNNTHSCWPTVDGKYVVTGEERPGGGITVYHIVEGDGPGVTLEITDAVSMPQGQAFSVHNQTVIGYRVFNSWYGAGLRVYDIDAVTGVLGFVASFDPPELDAAWGVYPFLGQHNVQVSDINNGLFIIDVAPPPPPDCNGNGVPDNGDIADGASADDNGNGIPDECEVISILSSDPPDGAIDARQPSEPDGGNVTGWSQVVLTFDGDTAALTVEDFTITLDPPGTPPFLAFVFPDGNDVVLQFGDFVADPIPPGHWTIITHNASGTSVRIGYLPADVNNDRLSNPNDVLALIDDLNGVTDPPLADYQTDTDRSGASNASDILRVIDLLNGAEAYDIWNGASLPK